MPPYPLCDGRIEVLFLHEKYFDTTLPANTEGHDPKPKVAGSNCDTQTGAPPYWLGIHSVCPLKENIKKTSLTFLFAILFL